MREGGETRQTLFLLGGAFRGSLALDSPFASTLSSVAVELSKLPQCLPQSGLDHRTGCCPSRRAMVQLKAWAGTIAYCSYIWLPLILFFTATTSLFFAIKPEGCAPSVLSGPLPKAAQQIYNLKNATAAPWFYTEWDVFPTRGVCPIAAHSGVTKDAKTGKTQAGDYKNCLNYGDSSWNVIDKYNAAANAPSLVNTSTAFHVSYQATLVAIVVSCVLALVACSNVFLSINAPAHGRHPYFSLLLLFEVLCIFLVFLLSCIIVGGPATSSMNNPKAWSVWFPTCNVVIEEREIPSIMYWLIATNAALLGLLIAGEVSHKYCNKWLSKRIALPGTLSDDAAGVTGGAFGSSGFIKVAADLRTRVVKLAFFGPSGATFLEEEPTTETTENKIRDQIPRRDAP